MYFKSEMFFLFCFSIKAFFVSKRLEKRVIFAFEIDYFQFFLRILPKLSGLHGDLPCKTEKVGPFLLGFTVTGSVIYVLSSHGAHIIGVVE